MNMIYLGISNILRQILTENLTEGKLCFTNVNAEL
jgi:hypothetical protein